MESSLQTYVKVHSDKNLLVQSYLPITQLRFIHPYVQSLGKAAGPLMLSPHASGIYLAT